MFNEKGTAHSYKGALRHTAGLVALAVGLSFGMDVAIAHEAWILTVDQMAELNARPLPELFTTLNATNVSLVALSAAIVFGWVLLGRTGAREMLPDLQSHLAASSGFASLAVRWCTAVMLIMAAFGLMPRIGTEMFEAPTLVAPELELRAVGENWLWLRWVELGIAASFLWGIYVRLGAALLLVSLSLGIALFGYEMWAYAGIVAGGGVYLLIAGPGRLAPSLPVPALLRPAVAWLEGQSVERAQYLLAWLVGLNLIYLGVEYKYLQANLGLYLLVHHEVPTFGMRPDTFVFVMALVETLAGVLMLVGVLMRAMAVVLFCAFVFLGLTLNEPIIAHVIFYGVLATFIFNGGGSWRRPVATDKPASVVILGDGFVATHAAVTLERMLGPYTNVDVTMVTPDSNFTINPLLADVLSGTVQPGNVVMPYQRLCPSTWRMSGKPEQIDVSEKRVRVRRTDGHVSELTYDVLISAEGWAPSSMAVPGLAEHAIASATVADVLHIRAHLQGCLERAALASTTEQRQSSLGIAVVGGGVRGCSMAASLARLGADLIAGNSDLKGTAFSVHLIEARSSLLSSFPAGAAKAVSKRLGRLGIQVHLEATLAAVTPHTVSLEGQRTFPADTVINTIHEPRKVPMIGDAGAEMTLGVGTVEQTMQVNGTDSLLVSTLGKRALFYGPREMALGQLLGRNAWSLLRNRRLRQWREPGRGVGLLDLGTQASAYRLFGRYVTGSLAAWAFRWYALKLLPGFEQSLRLLTDWSMNTIFRRDITVLGAQRSQAPLVAHFEPGDIIMREGDVGNCAYLIRSGRVAVSRLINGIDTVVTEHGPGECFGEAALITNDPRGTSIRCITPVDITMLYREAYWGVANGFEDLGDALRKRRETRRRAENDLGTEAA